MVAKPALLALAFGAIGCEIALRFEMYGAMSFEKLVTVNGVEYTLVVSPITCQSQQSQDCQPMPPASKANINIRQSKQLIKVVQVDCHSAGCKDEDWLAITEEALR